MMIWVQGEVEAIAENAFRDMFFVIFMVQFGVSVVGSKSGVRVRARRESTPFLHERLFVSLQFYLIICFLREFIYDFIDIFQE